MPERSARSGFVSDRLLLDRGDREVGGVFCHAGFRQLVLAEFETQDSIRVWNLQGGHIDPWSVGGGGFARWPYLKPATTPQANAAPARLAQQGEQYDHPRLTPKTPKRLFAIKAKPRSSGFISAKC